VASSYQLPAALQPPVRTGAHTRVRVPAAERMMLYVSFVVAFAVTVYPVAVPVAAKRNALPPPAAIGIVAS
jgi:hypothetical protein